MKARQQRHEGECNPLGTPSAGMALLGAYEATGENYYLEAAIEDRNSSCIDGDIIGFHPERHKRWFYHKDVEAGERDPKGRRNIGVYDDDNTRSALRF